MERGPVVRGLLNLVPAGSASEKPLSGESEESGCLRIGLGPVAGVSELTRDPCERVHQGEDGKTAPLPGDLQGLLRELLGNASLVEDLQDLVGVVAEASGSSPLCGVKQETATRENTHVPDRMNTGVG